MEGNKKDMKQLIKLRQTRPAFARTISWEFGKASEGVESLKKKKKAKKRSNLVDTEVVKEAVDDGEDEVSDNEDTSEESEYDTAPEDEMTELTDGFGDSVSTTDTFRTVYNDSVGADNDDHDDDDLSVDSLESGDGVDESDPVKGINMGCTGTSRRGRSKRQKRKRAETNRFIFANEFCNLMNVFDVGEEVDCVFEETKGTPGSLEVNKRVPSLIELCMKATRQRRRTGSTNRTSSVTQILPYGIKRLLTCLRHDQRMLSKQLSYLQNHILPRFSDKTGFEDIVKIGRSEKQYEEKKLKPPLRSVWACISYPFTTKDLAIPEEMIPSTKAPAFLYTPTVNCFTELVQQFDYHQNNHIEFYQSYIARSPAALSAFAVTIDLMLPSTVGRYSQKAKEQQQDDVALTLTKDVHTAIVRVKHALRQRYPLLVNEYFDLVMPYVMWGRGNVTMAVEMFHHLIQKETKGRKRAMYMSETARMLQQFGDEEGACKFYRMATELVSTTSYITDITDRGSKEVTEQCQILLANVYDTGVLNAQKGERSSHFWACAMGLQSRKDATVIAGIESLMCYHAAHTQDWLPTVLGKIEKHVAKIPYLGLHQSLIYALKGSETDSRRCFREFRMRDYSQVGENVLGYLGAKEKNPWKPLVEMIQSQKSLAVRPLPVVWRTQLLPPSLTSIRPLEAHFNSLELNLRITESGHLTGDMQMLLPPQRDITLDPYTGSLVINNCPSFTGEWKTAFLEKEHFYADVMVLPTPLLISSQEDGTCIHLLQCGEKLFSKLLSEDWHSRCSSMVVYWTGPNGQVAKVNLAKLIRDKIYKEMKKEIESKEVSLRNHISKLDIYDDTLKVLDKCYNQNLGMRYRQIVEMSRSRCQRRASEKKKLSAKGVKEKKLHAISDDEKFNIVVNGPPVNFGKTVVLHVRIANGMTPMSALLFIRTTDKTEFQAINIVLIPSAEYSVMQQSSYKDEEFLCYYSHPNFKFYNQFGTIVEDLTSPDNGEYKGKDCEPCIIGPYVYGMNGDRTSVWKHLIAFEEGEKDLEEKVTWSIVPYWSQLGQPGVRNEVIHVKTVGRTMTGKLLLLQLSIGLGFMDPVTMDFVAMELPEELPGEALTEDRKILIGQFNHVTVLTEKLYEKDGSQVCRSVLGINNTVMVIELNREPNKEAPTVKVVYRVSLPGIAKEACLVGNQTSLLISMTMNSGEEQSNYHEHVLYFNNGGLLEGILPFLSMGPRSFHSVYLHGNSDQSTEEQSSSPAGFYVYMRDGKGGILGVRLDRVH